LDDDETELLLEAVGDAVRVPGARALSCREREFQAGGVAIQIFNVLFDTGALHKSYISAELVDKHREEWSQCCGKLVLGLKPLHSRHKKGSKSLIVIKS